MAEVNLAIDGRNYAIACDDGQEPRLQQLAKFVDQRLREVSGGGNNKAQNMILASLVLADEVFDLNERLNKATQGNQDSVQGSGRIEYLGLAPNDEQNVVNLIGQMAAKVEKLTARVQKKSA
jgi:cell division protein ZapA